ncbi:hypothetical protein PR048_028293 [Dryococelus australis]|uniref:Uncharacterized protein n=1 Tax=Dryococelus australis TaxID=614101 RepID=A0ABQ9GIV0_9NEOP|nr:hypothetical protein PR048_028293 [Dryococelus australis]
MRIVIMKTVLPVHMKWFHILFKLQAQKGKKREAGLKAQEFSSCLLKDLKVDLPTGVEELILWSDSCSWQNSNIKIILMMKKLLEVHPTLQVESLIDKQQYLYTPSDYVDIMKQCWKKNPLVTRLKPKVFVSSANLEKFVANRKNGLGVRRPLEWHPSSSVMGGTGYQTGPPRGIYAGSANTRCEHTRSGFIQLLEPATPGISESPRTRAVVQTSNQCPGRAPCLYVTGWLASRGQGDVRGRGMQPKCSWATAALLRPHLQASRPTQKMYGVQLVKHTPVVAKEALSGGWANSVTTLSEQCRPEARGELRLCQVVEWRHVTSPGRNKAHQCRSSSRHTVSALEALSGGWVNSVSRLSEQCRPEALGGWSLCRIVGWCRITSPGRNKAHQCRSTTRNTISASPGSTPGELQQAFLHVAREEPPVTAEVGPTLPVISGFSQGAPVSPAVASHPHRG